MSTAPEVFPGLSRPAERTSVCPAANDGWLAPVVTVSGGDKACRKFATVLRGLGQGAGIVRRRGVPEGPPVLRLARRREEREPLAVEGRHLGRAPVVVTHDRTEVTDQVHPTLAVQGEPGIGPDHEGVVIGAHVVAQLVRERQVRAGAGALDDAVGVRGE